MDFWLPSAVDSNQICIGDPSVESMTALVCDSQGSVDNMDVCLGSDQLNDPDVAQFDIDGGAASIMGAGCSDDGGPLWFTMPLDSSTTEVWATFYQRVPSPPTT